jgi:hypothetical protein
VWIESRGAGNVGIEKVREGVVRGVMALVLVVLKQTCNVNLIMILTWWYNYASLR